MKQNMTKLTALLLLASTAMIACGSDAQTQTEQTAADTTAAVSETEAVTEELRPALGLPEMDFGGAEYRITCCYESGAKTLVAEEINGEAVNDTVFERNNYLSEKYNFTFAVEWGDGNYDTHTANVKTAVLAGDDAWELVYGNTVVTNNNAIAGIYMDLYDVPYLDFEQPWWPAQSVEQMTVYDKMFTICSGINYEQLSSSKILFFNKELLAAQDLETPYQWVLDGTWTMDKLISQTKDLYQDLNGDGKRDIGDRYGFATHPEQNGFLMSCDAQILAPTEDGGRDFALLTEKMADLVGKLYGWYYESGDVFLGSFRSGDEDFTPYVFRAGNVAYSFGHLYHATDHYRDSELKYGIVPMPKYDEQQDSYYVFACPSLFSVPVTCQNTELAGFVFEAMTYYGYYDVIPAYYELTLQGKIADSPEDAAMLELINEHLTVSFAYCYDNWQGFAHLLGERMRFTKTSGTKDLASAFEKYKKSAQKRLDKVLAGFADE